MFLRERAQLEALLDLQRDMNATQSSASTFMSKIVSENHHRGRATDFEAAKEAKVDGMMFANWSIINKTGQSLILNLQPTR